MRRSRRHTWVLLGALLLYAGAVPVFGELSFRVVDSKCEDALVMVIIEDVDPVGSEAWTPYRTDPTVTVVNPSGTIRGDGPPNFVFDPTACAALIVWPYTSGEDKDIAAADMAGGAILGPQFLTADTQDDLDPRVFVEPSGTAHVTWWKTGANGGILLRTRNAGLPAWGAPVPVTAPAQIGRRPSVAVLDGVLRVAYERDPVPTAPGQQVVVAVRQPGGGFSVEVVASTSRTERLDPVLHVADGKLWVDWKHAAGTFGFAVLGPSGWTAPQFEPWIGPSWVATEQTRLSVRRRVFAP